MRSSEGFAIWVGFRRAWIRRRFVRCSLSTERYRGFILPFFWSCSNQSWWVEFSDKRVAKRVANMLNGEQIGGKKRSSFYYDLWNIKYLSKFKWDNLTEEIAYKKPLGSKN
ncbi:uncharacterized protein [Malus domestica]|uniref:uncharacterized protein isoform X2 n=1 Tax=Malus domestica TaxID=3750 RepID=UPI0039767CA9